MKRTLIFISLVFIIILVYSCGCESLGDNRLVDKISLLEGDKLEDRAIIYCSNIEEECCQGGTYIVPSAEESYYKYIKEAKEQNHWIIAKAIVIENKKEEYFIIKNFSLEGYKYQNEKIDSIIKSNVFGPFDIISFEKELKQRGIDLTFDK